MDSPDKNKATPNGDMEETETGSFVVDEDGRIYLQVDRDTTLYVDEHAIKAKIAELESGCLTPENEKRLGKIEFAATYAEIMGRGFDLSEPAIGVLRYLCKNMDMENLTLFEPEKNYAQAYCKSSYAAHIGLQELIRKRIAIRGTLCMAGGDIYLVNPLTIKENRFVAYLSIEPKEGERYCCTTFVLDESG